MARWKEKAKQLQTEVHILYMALRDPRTPWYIKVCIAFVVAYILSPVDIIPDFIPILGYVDDIIIIATGIFTVRKMIPKEVLEEYRNYIKPDVIKGKSQWIAAAIIISIWMLVFYLIIKVIWL